MAQLINGLSLGASYALIAVGYTLVFGVLDVVNLAHGHVLIAAAFVALAVSAAVPAASGFVGLLAAGFLVGAVVGLLVERLTIKPLEWRWPTGDREEAALITTIAAAVIIGRTLEHFFSGRARPFPSPFTTTSWDIGAVSIDAVDAAILVSAIGFTVGLWALVTRTRLGRAVRATAEDPETAQLMGINTDLIRSMTFTGASALAGVSGVLLGVSIGAVSVRMADPIALKGLVILIVAGTRSIIGSAIVGLSLGVLETMVVGYGAATYRDAIAFGILILALLLKPEGLFGSSSEVR